jgi:hypothetical protein
MYYIVIDCWGGPVESPVYSRRQSSPFVDGTRVRARRTSGSFRHVGQVSPRWSLVLVGRARYRNASHLRSAVPSAAAAVPATLPSAAAVPSTVVPP